MNTYTYRVLNKQGSIVYIAIKANSRSEASNIFHERHGSALELDRWGRNATVLGIEMKGPTWDV